MPHPTSLLKSLGLTGRYIYLELKSNGAPFSIHFDLGMVERTNHVRISVSNLFKSFNTSNGFVLQVPLDLTSDRWTVACIDVSDLLARARLFPASYSIEGAHTIRSVQLCANVEVRGVYTSDNEYDFVTLPSDMRYKFPFESQVATKWPEYFDWASLPGHLDGHALKSTDRGGGAESVKNKGLIREEERQRMTAEINQLLDRRPKPPQDTEEDLLAGHNQSKKSRIGKLPDFMDDATPSNENNFNQFNIPEI